jgi:hypothetical protein
MFNAFGIHLGDAFGNAEAAQKGDNGFVPVFAGGGEGSAFFSQKNGAIGLGSDEAGVLKTGDGAIDSDVGDSKAFGEIDDARLADFGNEIGDGLDVVFGDFVCVFAPGLGEVFGLSFAASVRISD